MSSSYRSNRLGLSDFDPYAVHRGNCLELYFLETLAICNTLRKPGVIAMNTFITCTARLLLSLTKYETQHFEMGKKYILAVMN